MKLLLSALLTFAPLLGHALVTMPEGTGQIRLPRNDEPVPIWHRLFSIEFNETSFILFKRTTTGKWWYDAANGNEVITRADGRGDRYCGSIHPWSVTPCTHLVTGGSRYLIFPELDECCLCCGADMGCGILSPTWLDGASFQGVEMKNDHMSYKWLKKGLQSNYYYATANDEQIPVELDQWPNSYSSLHVDTFSTEAIDPELLKVPENCKSKCPLTSLCTVAG